MNESIDLAPPIKVAPRQGLIIPGTQVTFSWQPVLKADRYWLQIAEDEAFDALVYDQEAGSDLHHTVDGIFGESAPAFFWRIRSGNAEGWGAFGDAAMFRTVALATGEGTRVVPPYLAGWGEEVVAAETGQRSDGKEFMFLLIAIVITIVAAGVASMLVEHEDEGADVVMLTEDVHNISADSMVATQPIDQYGIVDSTAQVYQIPVEQAMEKIISEQATDSERGLVIER